MIIKIYKPSVLDRMTIFILSVIFFVITLKAGTEFLGYSILFSLVCFSISILTLIVMWGMSIDPIKFIILDDKIRVVTPIGIKKECKFCDITDVKFWSNKASYKMMELRKMDGKNFTFHVVNEQIIYDIIDQLDGFDIDQVMENYDRV